METILLPIRVGDTLRYRSELRRTDGLLDIQDFFIRIIAINDGMAQWECYGTIEEHNVLRQFKVGGFRLDSMPCKLIP